MTSDLAAQADADWSGVTPEHIVQRFAQRSDVCFDDLVASIEHAVRTGVTLKPPRRPRRSRPQATP